MRRLSEQELYEYRVEFCESDKSKFRVPKNMFSVSSPARSYNRPVYITSFKRNGEPFVCHEHLKSDLFKNHDLFKDHDLEYFEILFKDIDEYEAFKMDRKMMQIEKRKVMKERCTKEQKEAIENTIAMLKEQQDLKELAEKQKHLDELRSREKKPLSIHISNQSGYELDFEVDTSSNIHSVIIKRQN